MARDCALFTLNMKSCGPGFESPGSREPYHSAKTNLTFLVRAFFLDQTETDDQLYKVGRSEGGPWEGLRQRRDCPWSVRAEFVGIVRRWQGPGAAAFLRVRLPGRPGLPPLPRCFRRRRGCDRRCLRSFSDGPHVLFSGLLPAPSSLIKPF